MLLRNSGRFTIFCLTFWFQRAELHQNSDERNLAIHEVDASETNATIAFGHTVSLLCNFDQAVRCAWDRGGNQVDITVRYSYVRGNGTNTTHCSLQIRLFEPIDADLWECQSMAGSGTVAIKSTRVRLYGKNLTMSATSVKPNEAPAQQEVSTKTGAGNTNETPGETMIITTVPIVAGPNIIDKEMSPYASGYERVSFASLCQNAGNRPVNELGNSSLSCRKSTDDEGYMVPNGHPFPSKDPTITKDLGQPIERPYQKIANDEPEHFYWEIPEKPIETQDKYCEA